MPIWQGEKEIMIRNKQNKEQKKIVKEPKSWFFREEQY